VIEPVGSAVARELARFGRVAAMGPVVEAWAEAVGPEIARNAWPGRFGRDGSLRVNTRDSVWAFELAVRADELREQLGDLAPARLVFAPGPLPEPSPDAAAESSRRLVEPSAEHRARAASLVRGIRDDELREIVANTIAASLAAADSGRSVW
jgi:hypothetical protein